ncbi:hypothetical protein G3M48_006534 [Beauveria asiatica]|uniref:Uncharacterized protein n=1 Tax=Beauveria asiatica TaxID=1069075 RepID=A0AAW0RPI6_9HYPO
MKASVIIIILVAQALFTTAAAAVAARVSVDEILIRADPSPYRPAHGKGGKVGHQLANVPGRRKESITPDEFTGIMARYNKNRANSSL